MILTLPHKSIVPGFIVDWVLPEIETALGSKHKVTEVILAFFHNKDSDPCALGQWNAQFHLAALLHIQLVLKTDVPVS